MQRFSGKTVVVSGATRGLGKSITENFLEEGAHVIGLYAGNTKAAESFAAEQVQRDKKLEIRQCNIASEGDVLALFKDIEDKYQSIDILVNNAGIRDDAMLALMHSTQWQQVIDTNLTGTFLTQNWLFVLRQRPQHIPRSSTRLRAGW